MFKQMIEKRIEKLVEELEELASEVAEDEYNKQNSNSVASQSKIGVMEKDLLLKIHITQSKIMILKGLIPEENEESKNKNNG